MVKKFLCVLWGGMLLLCAGMGFVPEPTGIAWWCMLILALLAFVPPVILIYHCREEKKELRRIRNIAILSLSLTLVAVLANFLTLTATKVVGNVLYGILVVVSSPMVCGQIWIISLTLWACILWSCNYLLKEK